MTDMKLEVVVIPVTDVDRSTEFYGRLGWRLDRTPPTVVQFTPKGSACSVQFGSALAPSSAVPGSAKNYLIVADIETTRNELVAAGVAVDEIYHVTAEGPRPGLDPHRGSYLSRATFADPDGNEWLLQEVTTRLPGRIDPGQFSFTSVEDLSTALRRAAAAHGKADTEWLTWAAEYLIAEQAGAPLPS
ncbi:VOC family protein [Actinoplanes sp. NPDC051513]|uniref:VOC family protein n=1 Tax=Actinoplanes sp. NPDC051513 TaxID=3363908 RepID=UPI0037A801CF